MNGVGLGSLGATTLFGEYGQYNDQFNAFGGGLCNAFDDSFGNQHRSLLQLVQRIQFRRARRELRTSLSRARKCSAGALAWCRRSTRPPCTSTRGGSIRKSISNPTGINETFHNDGSTSFSKEHVGQGFDNWDLFQVGGIIFF